jgi:hypothetical protein
MVGISGVIQGVIMRTDGLAGLSIKGASNQGWNMELRVSLPPCEFYFSGLQNEVVLKLTLGMPRLLLKRNLEDKGRKMRVLGP